MAPDNTSLYKSPAGYAQAMALYDAMLAQITVPHQAAHVETRYGDTHVISAGPEAAPVVVLLHGGGAFGPQWVSQINSLADRYRLVVPDVIGSMGRSAPTRPDRDGPAYGEWLVDLLDQLQIDKAHMVGIANGTWLILKLATVAPERIASALLLSAAGFVLPRQALFFRMLAIGLLGAFSTPERRAERIMRVVSPPGHIPDRQRLAMTTTVMSHFKIQSAPRPLDDSQLARLTAPTTLLLGEYERVFNADAVIKRARALLPNLAQVERVPGVGHPMHVEAPEEVNQRILAFLAQQQD